MTSPKIGQKFSLYLDLMRFLAAVFVVLAHYIQYGVLDETVVRFVPDIGREAVIIFFVLSGYVIAYTTQSRRHSFREYMAARCARIYSVAFPVLLLAFAVVFIATQFTDAPVKSSYVIEKAYLYIPFHLLFMGQLWNLSEVPPWLSPYWSLGYEVWYYLIFGVAFYLNGTRRAVFLGLIILMMGHKLWLLLPIWMSGVILFRNQDRYKINASHARIGWVITLTLFVVYKVLDIDHTLRELGNHVWMFQSLHLGSADRYLADYLVCIFVVLNFYFALHAKFNGISRFTTTIRLLSSYTFTLYLVHGLVILSWMHFYKSRSASMLDTSLLTAIIIVVTMALGFITERKKEKFHSFFNRIFQIRASLLKAAPKPYSRLGCNPSDY